MRTDRSAEAHTTRSAIHEDNGNLEEGDDDADYTDRRRTRLSLSFTLFLSFSRAAAYPSCTPPRLLDFHTHARRQRDSTARFYRYLGRCLSAVCRRTATVALYP